MDSSKNFRSKTISLIIAISIFFSIILFNFLFEQKDNKIKEFAIDKKTKFVKEKINGKEIICNLKIPLSNCLDEEIKNNILLIGNSQLNGINQKKDNDYLTSHYLKNRFKQSNTNFITFALPNGSITEFLILYHGSCIFM